MTSEADLVRATIPLFEMGAYDRLPAEIRDVLKGTVDPANCYWIEREYLSLGVSPEEYARMLRNRTRKGI